MHLKKQETDGTITVSVSGKLSFKDHAEFNKFIKDDLEGKKVIFDVSGLEQIDSAGLAMFFLAQKVIEPNNGQMSITGHQGQVKKIFEITSLGDQITLI